MGRTPLPMSDYVTDTKSVLDNSLRVLQAMVDVSADAGWLGTTLGVINLIQCIMQVRLFVLCVGGRESCERGLCFECPTDPGWTS